MTADEIKRRTVTFAATAFKQKPETGAYIQSPNGRRWSLVESVTVLRQAGTGKQALRIVLAPVAKRLVPDGAIIVKQRQDKRQTRARTEPVILPTKRRSPAQIRNARIEEIARTAMRVNELLADDRATGRPIPAVRTQTIIDPQSGEVLRGPTVEMTDWIDPTDDNPNRRHARRVNGYRTADVLETLHGRGQSITKAHLRSAKSLRRDWEIAEGARPGYERQAVGGGSFHSTEPSEVQLIARRKFETAISILGPQMADIIEHVVLKNLFVRIWAKRAKQPEMVAMGILVAALNLLTAYYEPEKKRHTIRTDTP